MRADIRINEKTVRNLLFIPECDNPLKKSPIRFHKLFKSYPTSEIRSLGLLKEGK